MTFEKSFVLQKIGEISNYLEELKILFDSSDREILKDPYKLHSAERLLQLIVDASIDINQHFINELNLKVSEDLQGTFYILGENNVLPKEFSERIAPVVGLRNKIVHRYEEIDKDLFIRTFRKNYPDFEKYLKLINKYLSEV